MWQPSASLSLLKLRAKILRDIREFFYARNILEVETPLLSRAGTTDPYIHSFQTEFYPPELRHGEKLYLQTSPEFFMKRLLAADSGSIYSIGKAFRNGEAGKKHNPEFTMLEWYHLDFDHHQLMDKMDELLQTVLHCKKAERFSYADLFLKYCEINPHLATEAELENCCQHFSIQFNSDDVDKNIWLDLLMSHIIEPKLQHPTFVFDYPITQASLAKIRRDNPPVAERFEVYINGIELANGFHELANASEQRQRFMQDLKQRERSNYQMISPDEYFLSALEHGFPACAGVALGIDRLVMIASQSHSLSEVIAFPFDRI